jgi:hypothetical protein
MPEAKFYYPNCSCCSGSGSGSGSVLCDCGFFVGAVANCFGYPVVTDCKKDFVATISFSFSDCGSFPIGSCSSGSGASGAETGLDGPETGSGSDCLATCPNCCDIFPQSVQIDLVCIGTNELVSKNVVSGDGRFSKCFEEIGSVGSCLQYPSALDACNYFYLSNANFVGFYGFFVLRIDYYYATFLIDFFQVLSCEPLQISGTFFMGYVGNQEAALPCLFNCIGASESVDLNCIKGTFTITESLP